jgi:hypothetical protein
MALRSSATSPISARISGASASGRPGFLWDIGENVEYGAGLLFGVTDYVPDATAKFIVSYKF